MAAPNIVNVSLINANSNTRLLSTTSEVGLLSNPASSEKHTKSIVLWWQIENQMLML